VITMLTAGADAADGVGGGGWGRRWWWCKRYSNSLWGVASRRRRGDLIKDLRRRGRKRRRRSIYNDECWRGGGLVLRAPGSARGKAFRVMTTE